MGIQFDNTYAQLPEQFFSHEKPAGSPEPELIRVNLELAEELGIDSSWLTSEEALAVFSGNKIPDGVEPIAQAYAGHQFGGFVPRLGDGRAMLLGEVVGKNGKRRDVQLKGSGRTHFSRNGDGKSALGPVLREYLVSEAMHALGVPTTRALAAISTGEIIAREEPAPGGIFTRIASSHIRVGTFQYFAAQQDTESLQTLLDYAIARHYPEISSLENPATAFLSEVVKAQAHLTAKWLSLGFIHGVMNTDNSSISGETIDYGPCAFMDDFHPDCVFSYIDRNARYAWANQPVMAHWNLTRLAETLLPLISLNPEKTKELATAALDDFIKIFQPLYIDAFRKKLGIAEAQETEKTAVFIKNTLGILANQKVDFTLFFRHITLHAAKDSRANIPSLFADPKACDDWLIQWRQQLAEPDQAGQMKRINPIIIPRNHQIEQAIQSAYSGNFAPFNRLCEATSNPFRENADFTDLEAAPLPHEIVPNTFCGT